MKFMPGTDSHLLDVPQLACCIQKSQVETEFSHCAFTLFTALSDVHLCSSIYPSPVHCQLTATVSYSSFAHFEARLHCSRSPIACLLHPSPQFLTLLPCITSRIVLSKLKMDTASLSSSESSLEVKMNHMYLDPDYTPPESRSWCHQKSHTSRCVHLWTIENFSFYEPDYIYGSIFSPKFTEEGKNMLAMPDGSYPKWRLKLHPSLPLSNEDDGEKVSKSYVALYLEYLVNDDDEDYDVDENAPEIDTAAKAKFIFSIYCSDGKWRKTMRFKDVITFGKYGHEDWGTQAFVARDELFNPLNRLMIGDTLTICCEVTALSHVTYVSRPQNSLYAPLDNWQLTLQNDFSPLLLNKQYSDLNFVVYSSATAGEPTNGSAIQQDMKVIPVHRAIISMRFPFFNRLLNAHDPVKQIHIVDTDCEVFEALLFFVYSGQAPLEERLHLPLLALANKYQLEPLKNACVRLLSRRVTAQNVITMLVQANKLDAFKLKQQCIRFIRRNPLQVLLTAEWVKLLVDLPFLVMEIFQSM